MLLAKARFRRSIGSGVPADLDPPRFGPPGPYPLADMAFVPRRLTFPSQRLEPSAPTVSLKENSKISGVQIRSPPCRTHAFPKSSISHGNVPGNMTPWLSECEVSMRETAREWIFSYDVMCLFENGSLKFCSSLWRTQFADTLQLYWLVIFNCPMRRENVWHVTGRTHYLD